VLGSPPYFPIGTGIEGDHPQKGGLPVRSAAATHRRLRSRRRGAIWQAEDFSRASFLTNSWSESNGRPTRLVVILRRRPVVFKEGDPPLVGLFAMPSGGSP
jgi:hypothetical protein